MAEKLLTIRNEVSIAVSFSGLLLTDVLTTLLELPGYFRPVISRIFQRLNKIIHLTTGYERQSTRDQAVGGEKVLGKLGQLSWRRYAMAKGE